MKSPTRSANGTFRHLLAGFILLAMVVACLYFALCSFSETKWPSASAVVDGVEVVSWKSRRSPRRYAPQLAFHFSHADKEIHSTAKDGSFSTEDEAKLQASKHRAGESIKVFYNPSDPETATMHPGQDLMSHLGVGAVVLVLFLALTCKDLVARKLLGR